MWPILDTYGVRIAIAKKDGKDFGLMIERIKTAELSPNYNELTASGFKTEKNNPNVMLLQDKNSFTLGQLRLWFPNFNAMTMIDKNAPVAFAPFTDTEGVLPIKEKEETEKKEEESAKITINTPVKKEKIIDAGEKIGRARKDMYSKGVNIEDLPDMDNDSRKKYIKKTLLWPYSFKEAKERGVSCAVALWIKELRTSMPEMNSVLNVSYDVFFRCVKMLQRYFDHVKTGDELIEALLKVELDPDWVNYLNASKDSAYLSKDSRNKFYFEAMLSSGQKNAKLALQKNQSPLVFLLRYRNLLDLEENSDDRDFVWSNKLGVKTEKQLQSIRDKINNGPKIPSRPHLDNIRNDWLNGEDITAKQLMIRFGFRAIEFGRWLPQDERQRVLNEGYAACAALAETLGIPDKGVSLNGTLAAAFGSRGKGKAAAHYEPDLKVFNLTRMNGAGSMAHEWGHGLDNYIAEHLLEEKNVYASDMIQSMAFASFTQLKDVMKSIEYSSDISVFENNQFEILSRGVRWASSWLAVPRDMRDELISIIREEVLKAGGISLEKLSLPAITDNPCVKFTLKEASINPSSILNADDLYKKFIDVFENHYKFKKFLSFSNNPMQHGEKNSSRQFYLNIRTALEATSKLYNLMKNPNDFDIKNKENGQKSMFVKNAEKLDGKKSKKYWSTSRELFARAFESFVNDTLLNKIQRPCEYLVHSVGEKIHEGDAYVGNPYPTGRERDVINDSMAKFASNLNFIMSNDAKLIAIFLSDKNNDSEIYLKAKEVLSLGANPNQIVTIENFKPVSLFNIAMSKNSNIGELLIEYGLDTKNYEVRMEAIYDDKISHKLLQNGDYSIKEDINLSKNERYKTLLGAALGLGRLPIVKALIEAGADTEIPCDNMNYTALEMAVAVNSTNKLETIQYLIDAKAEITPKCIEIAKEKYDRMNSSLNESVLAILTDQKSKLTQRLR